MFWSGFRILVYGVSSLLDVYLLIQPSDFRSAFVEAFTHGRPSDRQELRYSAFAGSLSGAINGAFREPATTKHTSSTNTFTGSRSNIVPGAIMMGLLGMAGQGGYNALSTSRDEEQGPRRPLMARLADSRWMPLKNLSDEQYEEMLSAKLIKVEVEISLIDEKIATLHATQSTTPILNAVDDKQETRS